MPELLQRPTIEPNAQLLPNAIQSSGEGALAQFERQAVAEPIGSYVPRHAAERVSLRDRITQTRLAHKIGASVAALTVAVTGAVLEASPAIANSSQEYTVTDAAEGGVYSRNSPHMEDTPRIAGKGIYPGDIARLICGIPNGEAVNGNTTWHKIVNETRPEQGEFWENGSFVGVPDKPGELAPGEKNCDEDSNDEQSPEQHKPAVKACYFNIKAPSKNLTFSYNGKNDGAYYGNAWQAAKNWSDTGAGITIKPTDNNSAYIKFQDVEMGPDVPWLAMADIPLATEFIGAHKTVPSNPYIPTSVTILVNKSKMNKLKNGPNDRAGDFKRTYTLTHEVGHALGLGHTDELCGYSETSIMDAGNPIDTFKRTFNTPMPFDKAALKQLYE